MDGKKKGIEPSPVPIDPNDIKRSDIRLGLCFNAISIICIIWKIKNYELQTEINVLSPNRGIPNYEYKVGKITFIRNSRPQPKKLTDDVRRISVCYPLLTSTLVKLLLIHLVDFSVLYQHISNSWKLCHWNVLMHTMMLFHIPYRRMLWADSLPSLERESRCAKRAGSREDLILIYGTGFCVQAHHTYT